MLDPTLEARSVEIMGWVTMQLSYDVVRLVVDKANDALLLV